MKRLVKQLWEDRQGTLTFEWILLVTLLIIGIAGGISAVRDSILDELGDIAEAALAVDQSWTMRFCDCSTGTSTEVKFEDSTETVTRGRK